MPREYYFSLSTENIFKPHQTLKNREKKNLKNFLRQNKLGLSVRFSPFAYPILGYAIIFVFIDFFCSINSFLFTQQYIYIYFLNNNIYIYIYIY
jgi:hypothetical protein